MNTLRNTVLKLVIAITAITLCMPCTFKKQAKLYFNVPVSETPAAAKQNTTLACYQVVPEIAIHQTVVCKKQTQKIHRQALLPVLTINNDFLRQVSLARSSLAPPVPIYILNEQYLI
ncbi:hypothetical protein [Polluticaenibacter yanchengensis]|uniref:Uncharacterized protein n=1 Tax=Polluticaenibacter yanchengensis TaxID=3014562 RepID=A0ABT4UNK8_9BACT|nr:hypothetical protein [Chitinophagaceae bacterium LY-5]